MWFNENNQEIIDILSIIDYDDYIQSCESNDEYYKSLIIQDTTEVIYQLQAKIES